MRDYKIASGGQERSHGASPFNIKDESLTMRGFTAEEVVELYAQHTADTGQVFQPEALARVFELHEDRVRRIIEPILVGDYPAMDVMNDDLMYVRDLGLIVDQPQVRIANPIYREIIPRSLSYVLQSFLNQDMAWYQRPDGSVDMGAVLRAFQGFFAEHSEMWLRRYDYQEAGPHLILMAFLQKLVNGGGRIQREFAAGSGRADLVILWQRWRYVLELKLRRSERTHQEGIEQLSRYLDRLGEQEGYLLIFDRRIGRTWEEKIFEAEATGPGGKKIHVFGA